MPPLVVGLDEAGRGSVLGPLVVAAVGVEPSRLAELRALGVRDSKQLSPPRREALAAAIPRLAEVRVESLPPPRIDEAVRRHALNRLELEAFGRLLRSWDGARVYADACDPNPRRFAAGLRRLAPSAGPIVAQHRADERYPVVSAASILAKVERDRRIGELAQRWGFPVGSGYPSDPRTRAALRAGLAQPGCPFATDIRHSWRTVSAETGPSFGGTPRP